MRKLLFIPILVAAGKVSGQAGAAFTALGRNLANTQAQFGMANNPAYINEHKFNAGFYGQKRFTGTEINNGGFAANIKLKNTGVGVQMHYNGTEYFNRNGVEFSVGQKFSNKLSIGVAAGFSKIVQGANYYNLTQFTARIGAVLQISEKIDAACVILNPWFKSNPFAGDWPQIHIASGIKINTQTKVWGQFHTDMNNPAVYGVAIKHDVGKKLAFLASIQSGYEPVSGGLSYTQRNLVFSFATAYHTYLGLSPSFSFLWQMK